MFDDEMRNMLITLVISVGACAQSPPESHSNQAEGRYTDTGDESPADTAPPPTDVPSERVVAFAKGATRVRDSESPTFTPFSYFVHESDVVAEVTSLSRKSRIVTNGNVVTDVSIAVGKLYRGPGLTSFTVDGGVVGAIGQQYSDILDIPTGVTALATFKISGGRATLTAVALPGTHGYVWNNLVVDLDALSMGGVQ